MANYSHIDLEAFCKESGMSPDVGDFGSVDFNCDFTFDSTSDMNSFFDGENPFALRTEEVEPTHELSQFLAPSFTLASEEDEPILEFSQFIDDSAYIESETVQGESQRDEIFSSAETEDVSRSPWNESKFSDIEQPQFPDWLLSDEIANTSTREPLHRRRKRHIDNIDTTMTPKPLESIAESAPESPLAKKQKTLDSDDALMEPSQLEMDKHTPTAYLVALPSRTPSPKSSLGVRNMSVEEYLECTSEYVGL